MPLSCTFACLYTTYTRYITLIIQCSHFPSITSTNIKRSSPQVNTLSLGQSFTWGKAITNSACHPTMPPTCSHTHTHLSMHLETHPFSLKPPYTFYQYFISLIPSPSLSACHSLSLALCKIALRRAATVLRNSVIYWQFPPQVSGILYLNMSAATLNKTVLSIYISLPQPSLCHTAHGTQQHAVKYLPPQNVNGGGAGEEKERRQRREMEKCVPGWCFSCLDLLQVSLGEIPYQPVECFRIS